MYSNVKALQNVETTLMQARDLLNANFIEWAGKSNYCYVIESFWIRFYFARPYRVQNGHNKFSGRIRVHRFPGCRSDPEVIRY